MAVHNYTPFFLLKLEVDDRHTGTEINLYGKDVCNRTVVIRVVKYLPWVFASFRDRNTLSLVKREMCKSMRSGKTHAYEISIVDSANSVYKSLIVDRRHLPVNRTPDGRLQEPDLYGDTTLKFAIRIRTTRFNHIESLITDVLTAIGSADDENHDVRFYESNLDAELRVLKETGVTACKWCLLDTGKCTVDVDGPSSLNLTFYYDREAKAPAAAPFRLLFPKPSTCKAVECHLPDMPPEISVLSFDIECLAQQIDVFPSPDTCEIIQVSSVHVPDALRRLECLKDEEDGGDGLQRHVFVVGSCDSVPDTCVHTYDNERSMLTAFCDHLRTTDPDVITGYNIYDFDFFFLFERLKRVGVSTRGLGRRPDVDATCRINNFASTSRRVRRATTLIHGRLLLDLYPYMLKSFKMRTYTLNSVSETFLNDRKDDVHYTRIPELHREGPRGRATLAKYCVKDAELVVSLIFRLHVFEQTLEQCKVFNLLPQPLFERGQEARVMSMLLKWCDRQNILLDDLQTVRRVSAAASAVTDISVDADDDDGGGGVELTDNKHKKQTKKTVAYEGAYVMTPVRGFYKEPVVCLDFASLYPSIMIAYNLCYTTMIIDCDDGKQLQEAGMAERTPVGHYFFNAATKEGVLPAILKTLVAKRKEVRGRMAGIDPDSMQYRLLDGQQNALKIAANSIYGATGCKHAKLFDLRIPSSVTSYGRETIQKTAAFVEQRYGCKCVYGDTDSIMVHLADWSHGDRIWEAEKTGKEMASVVTAMLDRKPLTLQFETVYRPFLLMNKKRYASGVYRDLQRLSKLYDEWQQQQQQQQALAANSTRTEAAESEYRQALTPTVKCKGIEVVRRDNCQFATDMMTLTIDQIMNGVDPLTVIDKIKEQLLQLLRGDVNPRRLVISKQWTKPSKNPQPHDAVAQKMQNRSPNDAPRLGDRVSYLVLAGPANNLSQRTEDPLYALQHNLPIDYTYYAMNQCVNPIARILEYALPPKPDVVTHDSDPEQQRMDLDDIKDMMWPTLFSTRPGSKLTKGGTRKAALTKAAVGTKRITEFFAPSPPCKRAHVSSQGACSTGVTDIEECNAVLADCRRLTDTCLRCKGNDPNAVINCKNIECDTLFERYKVKRKLARLDQRQLAQGVAENSDSNMSLLFCT